MEEFEGVGRDTNHYVLFSYCGHVFCGSKRIIKHGPKAGKTIVVVVQKNDSPLCRQLDDCQMRVAELPSVKCVADVWEELAREILASVEV